MSYMQNTYTNGHYAATRSNWGRGLSIREVAAMVGASINTVRNWTNAASPFFIPDFPTPSRIGQRILRWSEKEVVEYLHATQAKGGKAE